MKKRLSIGLTILVAFSWGIITSAGEELILHAPKMLHPPTIDGKLNPGEWKEAAAINSFRGAREVTAYPEILKMVWYIGYDDKNLYLGMTANFPDKISLKAEGKENDDEWQLLRDDHLEIQIASFGRKKAKSPGYGFYKMMVNPRGTFSDLWYYCGTPGNEKLWSSGAKVKSVTTKTNWTVEICWPLSTIRVKKPDNKELIMHFSRAVSGTGWYFASSAPGGWESWGKFYRVILSPEAPAIQFVRKGDLVYGKLNTELKVFSRQETSVEAAVKVKNDKQQVIFQDKKVTGVSTGKQQTIDFAGNNLEITEKGNTYLLEINSGGQLLYNARIPFKQFTDEYVNNYMNSWFKSRPKLGEYKASVAYFPSKRTVRGKIDLDVFGGLPKKFATVNLFSIIVTDEAGKKITEKSFPIKNLFGTGLVNVGELQGGKYFCKLSLQDQNNREIDAKIIDFTHKKYPWKNNQIGRKRVVIPPFSPLKISGNKIQSCRSIFTIGRGGLFDSLQVDGKDVLASPMRFEATIDGKKYSWTGNNSTIEKGKGKTFPPDFIKYLWQKKCPKLSMADLAETDGYEAQVQATGKIASLLSFKLDGTMDYDGWYRIKLNYSPLTKAKIDSLDLIIELGSWADIMVIGRDIYAGAEARLLPEKDGILWKSGSDVYRPTSFKGTWVPFAYLGNGSRGIWYLAEKDQGWILDDNKSCVLVERINGKPCLRLRLINKPIILQNPRTVDFALLASPAKLRPKNYRHSLWSTGCPSANEKDLVIWFNSGWRCYGRAGDGFYLPKDQDYRELGNWILRPEKASGNARKNWWTGFLKRRKKIIGEKAWLEKAPVVIYSSHNNFSPSLPEMETYAGEWFGKSKLIAGKDFKFNRRAFNDKRTNYLGTYVWDTPARCGEIKGLWNQELIDCYLWYHRKLLKLGRINGTFYDNAGMVYYNNPDAGLGYIREDGHSQPQTSLFVRRQLTKRINTLCWLLGQPPLFFPNAGTFDMPFDQRMIGIEGDWYIWSLNGNFFDANRVQSMRAHHAKGLQLSIVTGKEVRYPYGSAGLNHQPVRSVIAMAVLHDFGATRMNWDQVEVKRIKNILKRINFFDKQQQAEFLPFWDNSDYVSFCLEKEKRFHKFKPNHVFCSIYRHQGKAMLWLVNEGREGKSYDLWIDDKKLLGEKAKTLVDMETGEEMTRLTQGRSKDLLRKKIWAHIYVPPQNFRALILE